MTTTDRDGVRQATGRAVGPLELYMAEDHVQIDRLLRRATQDRGRFDHQAFAEARGALLRHIAIEEKILFPDAKRRRGGAPLELAGLMRVHHGAIASLLVPTPDHALVEELRLLLAEHDPLEEGPGGLYETCAELAGDDEGELVSKARAMKPVPPAQHYDGPEVVRTARAALERSEAQHQKVSSSGLGSRLRG